MSTPPIYPTVSALPFHDAETYHLLELTHPEHTALGFGDSAILKQSDKRGRTLTADVGLTYVDIAYKTTAIVQPQYTSNQAEYVFVKSTDARDTAAGAGVQIVYALGIGESGDFEIDPIITDGVNYKQSSKKFHYISLLLQGTPGSNEGPYGEIGLYNFDGSLTYIVCPIEDASSMSSYFPVPAGWNAIILDEDAGLTGNKGGNYRITYRELGAAPGYAPVSPWRTKSYGLLTSGTSVPKLPRAYTKITGPAEIKMQLRVESTPAQLGTGRYGIVLVKAE